MIELDPISLREIIQPDRQQVQLDVVQAVQANPEHFFNKYEADSRSFGGRYVCADLFKETFPQYAESNDSCARYNQVVHNSAAVLAAAQYKRVLKRAEETQLDTVVFLTGIPGAGKTSHIAPSRQLEPHFKMVYEGQLSKPQSGMVKIQQALDAGMKVDIVVVHCLPEDALQNTYKRFGEIGRGASLEVMAEIQGNLPRGLKDIHEKFGDQVSLIIVDVRNRAREPLIHTGWDQSHIIQSEGSYENIKQRLTKQLEADYIAKRITTACYDQACGRAPAQQDSLLAAARRTPDPSHDHGRGLPQGSSQKPLVGVSATPYEAGKTIANLSHAKGPSLSKVAASRPRM